MNANSRKIIISLFGIVIALCIITYSAIGCSGENNRTPTAAEGKAADVKRQQYVDSLKLPDNVKAQMKSHLGGAPASGSNEAPHGGPVGPATGAGAKR